MYNNRLKEHIDYLETLGGVSKDIVVSIESELGIDVFEEDTSYLKLTESLSRTKYNEVVDKLKEYWDIQKQEENKKYTLKNALIKINYAQDSIDRIITNIQSIIDTLDQNKYDKLISTNARYDYGFSTDDKILVDVVNNKSLLNIPYHGPYIEDVTNKKSSSVELSRQLNNVFDVKDNFTNQLTMPSLLCLIIERRELAITDKPYFGEDKNFKEFLDYIAERDLTPLVNLSKSIAEKYNLVINSSVFTNTHDFKEIIITMEKLDKEAHYTHKVLLILANIIHNTVR